MDFYFTITTNLELEIGRAFDRKPKNVFFFLFYEKKIIKEIGVDTVKVVIISTAAANTEVYFNK